MDVVPAVRAGVDVAVFVVVLGVVGVVVAVWSGGSGGRVTVRDAAGRGSGAARPGPATAVGPAPAVLRAVAFSAWVRMSSAGVTSSRSQSAARTGSDSRSGVPVTSRWIWEADSVDAAFGQQRREVGGGEQPAGGHDLAQPPLVADVAAFIGCSRSAAAPIVAAAVPAAVGSVAWVRVASRARRRVRVRKSEDTQV